jgi:hypothetical protein
MNLGMHSTQSKLIYELETRVINRLYKCTKEQINVKLYQQLTNTDENSMRVKLYNEVGHNLLNRIWDNLVYEYYKK